VSRTIPSPLQAHLDGGATTMCRCWRVTRADGVVQGFTDHDAPLTLLGTTFEASTGFTATTIQRTLGTAVDNLEMQGALSSDSLNEDDLAAGKYDDAYVELFWVNWADVTQYVVEMTGYTGEAKRTGVAFSAELRGLSCRLGQDTSRFLQRTCDAVVGDSRCGVSLTGGFKGSGTVAAGVAPRVLRASGLGSFASGLFSRGVLKFTSGSNSGVSYEVKSHYVDGSGNVYLELWERPAFDLTAGWTFDVTAGCDKTSDMCYARFNNIANFRGFNRIPGNDVVMKNVDPTASNQGQSYTTTRSSK